MEILSFTSSTQHLETSVSVLHRTRFFSFGVPVSPFSIVSFYVYTLCLAGHVGSVSPLDSLRLLCLYLTRCEKSGFVWEKNLGLEAFAGDGVLWH